MAVDLKRVAEELKLGRSQVDAVVELLDEGNTVPFITRYRRERTGNLDEQQIRAVESRVSALRQLAERAETVMRSIEEQGLLTAELRAEILAADSLKRLEDLYLPFRPKRRSRATMAKERGLEPFAERVWRGDGSLGSLKAEAARFVDAAKELPDTADVLQGVSDILAERIAESPKVRERCRQVMSKSGVLAVKAAKKAAAEGESYRDYFDYEEPVSRVKPHRVLAINRGESEKVLRVKVEWDDARARRTVDDCFQLHRHRFRTFLDECAADALPRLVRPSLEREIRNDLTDRAEQHAIEVFAKNLRNLLLQPPLQGERIVAIDPGFRTGCKLAALDEYGNCLAHDVINITGSREQQRRSRDSLADFLKLHQTKTVAIGNGTACRETEQLVADVIAEHCPDSRYVVVNEAGASVYSASEAAREEFPELDATVRGTISIGRRLQDPLSELVKIDAQHIGVGMYQHDVSEKQLKSSLDAVVESCVNYVGVDLNTASAALLTHVSGLNANLAKRVVGWRSEHGRFANRKQLLKVSGIGEATFTQAAGFLTVRGGDEPLDQTWIHPENYSTARTLLNRLQLAPKDLSSLTTDIAEKVGTLDATTLAGELNVGELTCRDLLAALQKPGRDPRSELPAVVFRKGVLSLDDLHPGMELTGTVLNVVDFGAFVDVGLKNSGLVHISKLANRFVKSPHEIVSVGDVVTVWVLDVDPQRGRVSLTMVREDA